MERKPVSSSNIASIGYDENSQTLEIAFLSGGIYQYFGVPASVYAGFMSADSKGKYFAANIKGPYRFSKV